jgi:fucose 4-O-acetylase-like acetyltransferase
MSQRNITLDVAKGIGILAVVLGHNGLVGDRSELHKVLFSFHMPLFFFVAGVLLKEPASMKKFLVSRASSLLKPYFVVLLTLAGLEALHVASKDGMDLFAKTLGILYGTGPTLEWEPLWFLPHLFVTTAFSVWLVKSCSRKPRILPLIACLLLALGVSIIHAFWHVGASPAGALHPNELPGLPWSADLIPITASFMVVGYLLRNDTQTFEFDGASFSTALAVFVGLHLMSHASIDLNLRLYGNLFISTCEAYAGIYLVLSLSSLSQRLPRVEKLLAYIGSGSLLVLIFHQFLEGGVFWHLRKYGVPPYANAIVSFFLGSLLPLMLWEVALRSRLLAAALLPHRPILASATFPTHAASAMTDRPPSNY